MKKFERPGTLRKLHVIWANVENSTKNNFLQACRGKTYDDELPICPTECDEQEEKQSSDEPDATPEICEEVGSPKTTPAGADFLVCYSTAHG